MRYAVICVTKYYSYFIVCYNCKLHKFEFWIQKYVLFPCGYINWNIRKWVGLKSVGAAAPPMIVNRMMRCLKSGQKHFQDLSEKQIFDTNIIDNLRSGHWKRYSIWRLASAHDNGIRWRRQKNVQNPTYLWYWISNSNFISQVQISDYEI